MSREKPLSGTDEPFLSRWSRRKHAAARPETATPDPVPAAPKEAQPLTPASESAVPAQAGPQLPPVESLTSESDFSPFMASGVDDRLKRVALKTLFQDPRFNVMDGLDVYIDDYSKPDPLPEGWLEKLNQVARLGEYRDPEAVAQAEAPDGEQDSPPASEGAGDGASSAPPSVAADEKPQP